MFSAENLMQIATRCFGPERDVDLDLPARDRKTARAAVDFGGSGYDC